VIVEKLSPIGAGKYARGCNSCPDNTVAATNDTNIGLAGTLRLVSQETGFVIIASV
jgi:hypothetical protein